MHSVTLTKIIGAGLFMSFLLNPARALAMDSADCFDCHADRDTVGDVFFIDTAPYRSSAHAEIGCVSCHETVSVDHPNDGNVPSRVDCLDCHDDVGEEYTRTGHAENATCRDCHNPHMVRGVAAVSGHTMNRMCAGCHDRGDVVATHAEWLPQVQLHIAMLPCISCHTASEELIISLFIIKRDDTEEGRLELVDHDTLSALAGSADVQGLVDLNHDDYISLAELRLFNRNPANKAIQLQGMMMPEEATHSIEILDNRWDCSFCHASGPDAMQTSYLCLVQPDQSFQRVPVERGAVLDALFGTPDFYMVGATRSKLMNSIGLAIISGGLVLPVGHGSLRFLTRKNRRKERGNS